MAQVRDGAPRLIAAGCAFGAGRTLWRLPDLRAGSLRNVDKVAARQDHRPRSLALSYAPANTRSGRAGASVFDRSNDRLILYADRKLMAPEVIAIIREHFHLPADRTSVKGDIHYKT